MTLLQFASISASQEALKSALKYQLILNVDDFYYLFLGKEKLLH